MTSGKNISQNEVAGFLLGLGIGLVVGLLSQPKAADQAHGLVEYNTGKTGGSAPPGPRSGPKAVEESSSS